MSTALVPPEPAVDLSTDDGGGEVPAGLRHGIRAALAPFDRPLTSYYLIIGITGLLLALGLVMVLSTSSASQLDSGQSPYAIFVKQLLGVLVGLPMMWGFSRVRPALFRAVAYPLLLATLVALVLVLAFGTTVGGAERWIDVAGIQVQPSEFAKLAYLLWGADLLARKEKLGQLKDWRMLMIPLLPGAVVLGMLVMLGDDLGTTFVLLVIFLALIWVIGTPGRMMVGILGMIGFVLLVLIVVAPYRFGRLTGFFHPQAQTAATNWQANQSRYAIGSGGIFGVGLGNGTQKWGWVPNAGTDFIFAILGEELGLIGTGCVVLLYGGLAYAGLRIARRMTDPFIRLAAAGATAWIVTQALVNIGAVVGLLPITGVPLPLISAGLSSLLVTMAALGMLLCFARREPGASQALAAAGPGLLRRALRLPGHGGSLARSDPELAAGQPRRSPARARPAAARPGSRPGSADPASRSRPARPDDRSRPADPEGRPVQARPDRRAGQVPPGRRPA